MVCGQRFQPYRKTTITCSTKCYKQQQVVKDRDNAARRTPERRAHKNEWRRTDPHQRERIREYNREQQLARYGLTPAAYEEMWRAQGGLCAICYQPATGAVRAGSKLHVDHDHGTGEVRDLLCNSCNRMVGYAHDDPALLRAAAEYIEAHRLRVVLPAARRPGLSLR